jgi:hypothetical protein
MKFSDASRYVMPFGQHIGKTLDQIGSTDAGLLYLDWLRGEKETQRQGGPLINALSCYLDDPTIAGDLAKMVRE